MLTPNSLSFPWENIFKPFPKKSWWGASGIRTWYLLHLIEIPYLSYGIQHARGPGFESPPLLIKLLLIFWPFSEISWWTQLHWSNETCYYFWLKTTKLQISLAVLSKTGTQNIVLIKFNCNVINVHCYSTIVLLSLT